MTKIERFQAIEAWQKACELTRHIYAVSNDGAFARDFGLRDQIRRASVSVMSNIAEGLDREGKRELIQFLYIAKGSAVEVQAQLYVALDAKCISQEQFEQLYNLIGDTSRLIGGFISIARESLAEVETQLLIAIQLNYIHQQSLQPILAMQVEVNKMTNALISKLVPSPSYLTPKKGDE